MWKWSEARPCLFIWMLFFLGYHSTSLAIDLDPEESDFPPGLLATYQVKEETVQRIDPDLAFDWQANRPDMRLPHGPFSAHWQGLFLVKSTGLHQFHAYLSGEVTVSLDGQILLSHSSDEAGWVSSEPFALAFGEKELDVRYRRTGDNAAIKLFWSSEQFMLEPISTHLLYREAGRSDLSMIERGRLEFRSRHCDRCHSLNRNTVSQPAPSLLQAAAGLSAHWIVNKLKHSAKSDKMPHFEMQPGQAESIAYYLLHASKNDQKIPAVKIDHSDKQVEQGELLTRSVGCLACHQIGDLGHSGPFGGGSLDDVGKKRSSDWLAAWLKAPEKLNKHHRMPVIALSNKERLAITSYLVSLPSNAKSTADNEFDFSKEDPQQMQLGKKWIQFYGCISCHEIPGFEQQIDGQELPYEHRIQVYTEIPQDSQKHGCLQPRSATSEAHQPYYPHADNEALRSWLTVWLQNKHHQQGPESDFSRGADLLVEKNCLACHERDRSTGIVAVAGKVSQTDSRLTGQSQGLIPPNLTAVGDRLQPEALKKGISGELPTRLPWLSVRMPRFEHTSQQERQFLHYLTGHDQIPDQMPDPRLQLASNEMTAADRLLVGRELTGGRAFNCIACHKIGEYEPRNTALGTRGSDLLSMSSRIRTPYFLRWTASPLRIVPGMEMPSYNQPKPGYPVNTAHEQLTVLWHALNHPDFRAPSNPAVVEQYLVVQPGEQARIIRDVFERTGVEDRQFISRPLAIGLNNGHSLLFDLDLAAIREWTYGDFAFQQTEGKSWYWYMAGAPVVKSFEQKSDFVLIESQNTETRIDPLIERFRSAKLLDYQLDSEGVRCQYELLFEIDGTRHSILITEFWTPIENDQGTGFHRQIDASKLPQGYQLALRQRISSASIGDPTLTTSSKSVSSAGKEFIISFKATTTHTARISVTYQTNLRDRQSSRYPEKPEGEGRPEFLSTTPGFESRRLPLSTHIMPTAITWNPQGQLLATSLKGHLYAISDSNEDGLEDEAQLLVEGLSAPFGVYADGDDVLVAHKPEVLRMTHAHSGRPLMRVVADGWGHNDNYHDWISGFAQDETGALLIATGSDYAQSKRPQAYQGFRGDVLKLTNIDDPSIPIPIASALRYPIGIASDDQGRIFTSDQQGVQNCFNEINHIKPGRHYGVPGQEDDKDAPQQRASIQIPHPWTRSVNGIFFIPSDIPNSLNAFAGHGIGCEYNHRFLIRFSLQEVAGELQGACYALTQSAEHLSADASVFLGPICGAVSPAGNLYIGNFHDSGWLGGQNTGEFTRMVPAPKLPNGIREVTATPEGFVVELLESIPENLQQDVTTDSIDLSGYTRVWQGGYATEDSGRYRPKIEQIEWTENGRSLVIQVDELRAEYLYELHLDKNWNLFPSSAYYTMNIVPR